MCQLSKNKVRTNFSFKSRPLSNAINYAISSVYIHQIYSTHPCQFLLNHISSVSQRPCPSTAIFEVSSRPNWLQPAQGCKLILLSYVIIITYYPKMVKTVVTFMSKLLGRSG